MLSDTCETCRFWVPNLPDLDEDQDYVELCWRFPAHAKATPSHFCGEHLKEMDGDGQ